MCFSIREVVCDYGIYENDELKIIVSSYNTAKKIMFLLVEDYLNSLKSNRQLIDLIY